MPADEWHLLSGGRVWGPYSTRQLQEWASRGEIKRDSYVQPAEGGSWIPAARLPFLWSDWYENVYLKSDHWRNYRKRKLEHDRWECADCHAAASQVHHERMDYTKLWRETVADCVSLCGSCHQQRHAAPTPVDAEIVSVRFCTSKPGATATLGTPKSLWAWAGKRLRNAIDSAKAACARIMGRL